MGDRGSEPVRFRERDDSEIDLLETLFEFQQSLLQMDTPELGAATLIAKRLVVAGCRLLHADGGTAGFLEGDEVDNQVGQDQRVVGVGVYHNDHWYSDPRSWNRDEGDPGRYLNSAQPIITANYPVSQTAEPEWKNAFQIGGSVGVAIRGVADNALGFVQLHHHIGGDRFLPHEARLLQSMATMAAGAIENRRMIQKLNQSHQQSQELAARHVRHLEAERRRFSREIHDETGQVLIGLKLRLQLLARHLMPCQIVAGQVLSDLRDQVNGSTTRLKEFAKGLRPPTLDSLGLKAAVEQLVHQFRRSSGLIVKLDASVWPRTSEETQIAIYRIVQESLTNVGKHASAKQVTIRLRPEGSASESAGRPRTPVLWCLEIEDDGAGFQFDPLTPGLGIFGMYERAAMVGGQLHVESRCGWGTRIRMTWPPAEAHTPAEAQTPAEVQISASSKGNHSCTA